MNIKLFIQSLSDSERRELKDYFKMNELWDKEMVKIQKEQPMPNFNLDETGLWINEVAKIQEETRTWFSSIDAIKSNKLFNIPPKNPKAPTRGIAVDCGSVNGKNPGLFEYRLVDIETGELIINTPIPGTTSNNLAEYYAIIHAIMHCIDHNLIIDVYSDSLIAIGWLRSKQCRTKLVVTDKEQLKWIERGVNVSKLKHNIKVLKWHTNTWGEIPADYGNKTKKRNNLCQNKND
jgi:ribonuclease HI